MASRAATLVKPKPVGKANAKAKAKGKAAVAELTPKSSATKSATLKSSSTSVKRPAAKLALDKALPAKMAGGKAVTSKAVSAAKPLQLKATINKSPLSKPKLLKTIETKAPAARVLQPATTALAMKSKVSLGEKSIAIAGAASFETAAPKPRRRAKGEIRTRIYWAVFNQSLRRVAVFEFDQRDEAEKRAARLTKASGEHHFLQKIKAIVQ